MANCVHVDVRCAQKMPPCGGCYHKRPPVSRTGLCLSPPELTRVVASILLASPALRRLKDLQVEPPPLRAPGHRRPPPGPHPAPFLTALYSLPISYVTKFLHSYTTSNTLYHPRAQLASQADEPYDIELIHRMYAATKHGLVGLTRSAALEVASCGVTVNAICPGPVRTVMFEKLLGQMAERDAVPVDEMARRVNPLGRLLEPMEVAELAVYLASEKAASMTGQSINIDGGIVSH